MYGLDMNCLQFITHLFSVFGAIVNVSTVLLSVHARIVSTVCETCFVCVFICCRDMDMMFIALYVGRHHLVRRFHCNSWAGMVIVACHCLWRRLSQCCCCMHWCCRCWSHSLLKLTDILGQNLWHLWCL